MAEITYTEEKTIDRQSMLNLYNNAGWTSYTIDPEMLVDAIQNSLYVLTAWHGDTLVGLLRIVGDGLTIVYIQDILVLTDYKRKRIGTTLMEIALEKFDTVRQKVLLTEDSEETRAFYESMGFESCDKGQLVSFVKSN